MSHSPQPIGGSSSCTASTEQSYPWQPDGADGTYRNPVLYADYSDPDVIRVGDDYYLTASSFTSTPGLPILHSRDLVNWTLIGHALKHVPDPRYEQVQPGCGVWASAIRHHAGKFWIFFPTPDEGIYVITAANPAGPWTEPHLVQGGKGLIDPCPLWDDDGKAYLVHAYAGSRAGIKHRLRVCPMAPDGSRLLGEGEIVFHQPEKHPTLEGPKFLKKDGWYYILAPAGGVETGWQVVLRSKNIFGPYEDKIVLAQGDTPINGPHQGALVDAADGRLWFVHFQDAGVYGRIVHLQPVRWQDGWPLMGDAGKPVLYHAKPVTIPGQSPQVPATSDDFSAARLGFQWQWQANYQDDWCSLTARAGWLRLYLQPANKVINEQPNLLLQKFPARCFAVETLLEFAPASPDALAGLVVAGEKSAVLGVRLIDGRRWIVLRIDDEETPLQITDGNSARLRVEVRDGGECVFSHASVDGFVAASRTFSAVKGKWVGAKVGLYAVGPVGAHADFKYFRFA